jgi:hypothetical protein
MHTCACACTYCLSTLTHYACSMQQLQQRLQQPYCLVKLHIFLRCGQNRGRVGCRVSGLCGKTFRTGDYCCVLSCVRICLYMKYECTQHTQPVSSMQTHTLSLLPTYSASYTHSFSYTHMFFFPLSHPPSLSLSLYLSQSVTQLSLSQAHTHAHARTHTHTHAHSLSLSYTPHAFSYINT